MHRNIQHCHQEIHNRRSYNTTQPVHSCLLVRSAGFRRLGGWSYPAVDKLIQLVETGFAALCERFVLPLDLLC